MNENLNNLGVCIPCHVKNENDLILLHRALESIRIQTLRPREIVISDDSPQSLDHPKIIASFPELNIQVSRNSLTQGIASNSNFGVSHLTTDWIHVLHQDDWLSAPSSYEEIMNRIKEFDKTHRWFLVSGNHEDGSTTLPVWKKSNLFGFNSIGGPSCLFTRTIDYIPYDERYRMLVDVKNYSDYFNSFGNPGVIGTPQLNYGNPPTRVSRNISLDHTLSEIESILKIESLEIADVIKCLKDSTLNPYHRFLILKLARENLAIPKVFYIRLFVGLLFARLKFKYIERSRH